MPGHVPFKCINAFTSFVFILPWNMLTHHFAPTSPAFSVEKNEVRKCLAAELSRGSHIPVANLCGKWGISHPKPFHFAVGSCPLRPAWPTPQTSHCVWDSSSSEDVRPASTSFYAQRSALSLPGGGVWGKLYLALRRTLGLLCFRGTRGTCSLEKGRRQHGNAPHF